MMIHIKAKIVTDARFPETSNVTENFFVLLQFFKSCNTLGTKAWLPRAKHILKLLHLGSLFVSFKKLPYPATPYHE
jgi:hypothetical protein